MRVLIATAIALTVLSGCTGVSGSPTPSICDGIPAEFGGCDPDRPVFGGTTCAAVGTEFGEQLSPRAVAIFDGPQTVDDADRTVRFARLVTLHVQLANKHLRDSGQIEECGAPEFRDAAVAALSEEFREGVGTNVYFGQTITFDDWVADLDRFLVVLDTDEHLPYDPRTSPQPTS